MFGSSGFFQGIEFDVGFPVVQPFTVGRSFQTYPAWSIDTDYGSNYQTLATGNPYVDSAGRSSRSGSSTLLRILLNTSSTEFFHNGISRDDNGLGLFDYPGWQLGYSVSLFNNYPGINLGGGATRFIVGVPSDSNAGAVKIFNGSLSGGVGGLTNAGNIEPFVNIGDRYGSSVKARYITSLGGMLTLVGAEGADNGRGTVRVNSSILTYPGPATDLNPKWGNNFHFDTNGKWVFIGAPGSDNGEGSVWIYQITNDALNPLNLWGSIKSPSPQVGARFGECITANTLETVFAVGEPGWNSGQGRAHIFLLNPNPVFSYSLTSNSPIPYSATAQESIDPPPGNTSISPVYEDFTPKFGFSLYLDYFGGKLLIGKPGLAHGQRFLGLVEQYQNNGDGADYLGDLTQANITSASGISGNNRLGAAHYAFGYRLAKANRRNRLDQMGVIVASVMVNRRTNVVTAYNGYQGDLLNFSAISLFE